MRAPEDPRISALQGGEYVNLSRLAGRRCRRRPKSEEDFWEPVSPGSHVRKSK